MEQLPGCKIMKNYEYHWEATECFEDFNTQLPPITICNLQFLSISFCKMIPKAINHNWQEIQ